MENDRAIQDAASVQSSVGGERPRNQSLIEQCNLYREQLGNIMTDLTYLEFYFCGNDENYVDYHVDLSTAMNNQEKANKSLHRVVSRLAGWRRRNPFYTRQRPRRERASQLPLLQIPLPEQPLSTSTEIQPSVSELHRVNADDILDPAVITPPPQEEIPTV